MSAHVGADVAGGDVATAERLDEAAVGAQQLGGLVAVRVADDDRLAAAVVEAGDGVLARHGPRQAQHVGERLVGGGVRVEAGAAQTRPERGVVQGDDRPQPGVGVGAEGDLLVTGEVDEVGGHGALLVLGRCVNAIAAPVGPARSLRRGMGPARTRMRTANSQRHRSAGGHRGARPSGGSAQRRAPRGSVRTGWWGTRSAPGPCAGPHVGPPPASRSSNDVAAPWRLDLRGAGWGHEEPRGLRVGYKASAEQFAPGELAGFAVRAEELGLDSVTISDHFQPWRLRGRPRAELARLDVVGARPHRARAGRHLGDDADLPLQPGRRRADLRDDGLPGTRAG